MLRLLQIEARSRELHYHASSFPKIIGLNIQMLKICSGGVLFPKKHFVFSYEFRTST